MARFTMRAVISTFSISAKTAATRVARIAKFRPKILAGKGAQER